MSTSDKLVIGCVLAVILPMLMDGFFLTCFFKVKPSVGNAIVGDTEGKFHISVHPF